jgi:cytoskeletal protein CcmA (bactofilin family)
MADIDIMGVIRRNEHVKRLTMAGVFAAAALMLLGVGTMAAYGQSFTTGDTVTIGADQTVDSTLFAAGRTLDIAGTVNGDVFCGGQTVTITGVVNGDVICGAQALTLSGQVSGDIRIGAQTVTITGSIGQNATLGAQTITIGSNASIGGDLSGGAQDLGLHGQVGRDLALGAERAEIFGTVGRDITATIEGLTIQDGAVVGGDVDYTAKNDLTVQSGAEVQGTITRHEPPQNNGSSTGQVMRFTPLSALYAFSSFLLGALLLTAVFPGVLARTSDRALKRPLAVLGVGVLALILVPLVFVGLLLTFIGIPLALALLLLWIVGLMVSGPFTAFWLGRLLFKDTTNPFWLMLAGSVLMILALFVPILGVLVVLLSTVLGLGMAISTLVAATPKPRYSIGQ